MKAYERAEQELEEIIRVLEEEDLTKEERELFNHMAETLSYHLGY